MKSYLCCLSLALLNLVPYAEAQLRSHEHEHESVSVSGEVETRSAFEAGMVVVLSGDGDVDRRADVHSGGEFEFANVPTGHYELKGPPSMVR
jgi:hypothetical protein